MIPVLNIVIIRILLCLSFAYFAYYLKKKGVAILEKGETLSYKNAAWWWWFSALFAVIYAFFAISLYMLPNKFENDYNKMILNFKND